MNLICLLPKREKTLLHIDVVKQNILMEKKDVYMYAAYIIIQQFKKVTRKEPGTDNTSSFHFVKVKKNLTEWCLKRYKEIFHHRESYLNPFFDMFIL